MAKSRFANRGKKGQFQKKATTSKSLFQDYLTPGIGAYAANLPSEVHRIMREHGAEMVAYARENAPWRDRTGDAREGIDFSVDEDINNPTLYLFHTVSYGVWLEVRWNGEYAIIIPTLEAMGPELMLKLGGIS